MLARLQRPKPPPDETKTFKRVLSLSVFVCVFTYEHVSLLSFLFFLFLSFYLSLPPHTLLRCVGYYRFKSPQMAKANTFQGSVHCVVRLFIRAIPRPVCGKDLCVLFFCWLPGERSATGCGSHRVPNGNQSNSPSLTGPHVEETQPLLVVTPATLWARTYRRALGRPTGEQESMQRVASNALVQRRPVAFWP